MSPLRLSPGDLMRFYEVCIRDAQVSTLSAKGRFQAARDAACACAVAMLPDVERAAGLAPEVALLTLSRRPDIDAGLAKQLSALAHESIQYAEGIALADEAAVSRAFRCAFTMHATTIRWLARECREHAS